MPVSDTLIIKYTDVKEETTMPKTVSDLALKPSLKYAHAKLEKVLGRTFYAEIQAAIDLDDTLSGEANLLTLVRYYAKPYVAWMACLDFYVEHYGSITKTGVHHKSSDDYDPIPVEVLKLKINSARDKVDEYQDQLQEYLKNSTLSDYDSYNTTTGEEERILKTNSAGIAYPRKNNSVYYNERVRRNIFYPNDDCIDC
jgi:hypothetical protein